jgi:chromate transporter
LLLAGICFILPAALLTTALAWAYVKFGTLPAVAPLISGVKPAVLVIILVALFRLGKSAVKSISLAVIGFLVLLLALFGFNEILALLFGAVAGTVWLLYLRGQLGTLAMIAPLALSRLAAEKILQPGGFQETTVPTLWQLGGFFLKIGSVLLGSGYILVAFLESDLVREYGWLTQTQLMDAIAIGQFTPGPVLTTATFIGYLLLGPAGAFVATVAIFAPSFLFVVLLNPLVPRLRGSPWASGFLDAVNVSAVGLMGAVLLQLGRSTLVGWEAWLITLVLALLAFYARLSSAWLVLIGAGLGWILLTLT